MMRNALQRTLLAAIFAAGAAQSFGQTPTPSYSGDFLSRSTLTGDWGGLRNDLANKGMTFDLSITQVYQGVIHGGRDQSWNYAGRGDFLFNLDTGKAGLWQGGFLTIEAEGNWGNNINRRTGSIMPVDSSDIYPEPGGDNIDVPNVTYAQFVSPHLGFVVGKMVTLSATAGDMNAFAHGKGDDNFMNLAFNINPVALIMPYSGLGAGVVWLPGKTPDDAVVQLAVIDAEGNPGTTGFDTVFEGGTIYSAEGRIRTDVFGKTGHQLVGGIYSDKLYNSIDQNARFIIQNRALRQTSSAWSIYYNFDQFLYEPVKGSGKGIGLFGRFGISDGDPNPIKTFWSVGLGGKGVCPGRTNDSFGVGYYAIYTSNQGLADRLDDEWGIETYYTFALTPWAELTADLQYVDSALANSDPALVLGARLRIKF
jgi:porin